MTNVVNLHPGNHEAAAALLAWVPEPNRPHDRDEIIGILPDALNYALSLILAEFDYDADPTCRLAVAARVLAAMIDRLGR
jgi:hypothetical protein